MDHISANIEALWHKVAEGLPVDYDQLAPEIQNCLIHGDGLADHYGGRTPFLFADYKNERILVLEKLDADGNVAVRAFDAINCTGGYGTGILGSDVAKLENSVRDGLRHCPTANDEFHSLERYTLVNRVRDLIGTHTGTNAADWEVSFTSTGTEAMDLAMQLALLDGFDLGIGKNKRQHKDVLIACHGAWHGWGLNPNQLLDRRQFTEGLPRFADHQIVFMRYGDQQHLQAVFEQYRGRIRAVFVEGILGDGGVVVAANEWWNSLFELAGEEDAKIIDDEILTGLRCGSALAIPQGLAPDCITLGKALGFSLFPISAVLWKKDRLHLRPGIGVRTFNARPFQAKIVTAGLEIIEREDLFSKSRRIGDQFLQRLQQLAQGYPEVIKDVRGRGFFFGLELAPRFGRKGHFIRNELLRHGVLTEIESGILGRQVPKEARINETIRLTPPLTMTESDLDQVFNRISEALKTLVPRGAES